MALDKKNEIARKIERPVGTFYHYSYEEWVHNQDHADKSETITNYQADAVADQFNELCQGSKHNAGKVLVQLSKGGRIKVGDHNYSVKRDGVVFIITH